MKKLAKAANPGRCAWSRCDQPGDHIFEHRGWRILACSMKCALIAFAQVEKIPEDLRPILFDPATPKADKLQAIEEYRQEVDF